MGAIVTTKSSDEVLFYEDYINHGWTYNWQLFTYKVSTQYNDKILYVFMDGNPEFKHVLQNVNVEKIKWTD